jgi:hypothetical protein
MQNTKKKTDTSIFTANLGFSCKVNFLHKNKSRRKLETVFKDMV